MSRRSDQLRTVADDFCKIHNAWADDKNRIVPDEVYWDGVDALIETFGSGDIPEECRGLHEAVQAFREERDEFDSRDDTGVIMPGDGFWRAREAIQDALTTATATVQMAPIESIASLRGLNPPPTDTQIALIWNFVDRFGNPMPQLVQKELDVPGSVTKTPGSIDGQDWVHPHVARARRKGGGNQVAERNAAVAEKRQKVAKSSKPCAETPRDLWELGLAPGATPVSVKQAARMLCLPEGEVARLFAQFEADREAALEAGDVIDATTQAIREKASAGMKPKEIAEELGVDAKKVTEALKGWKKGKAA